MSRFAPLLAVLVLALPFAGCGGTVIDHVKTEGALAKALREGGRKVASVECPSGVEVKAGNTFECTVNLKGGKVEKATLKVVDDKADVHVTDVRPAGAPPR